jgi:hypothetical protein
MILLGLIMCLILWEKWQRPFYQKIPYGALVAADNPVLLAAFKVLPPVECPEEEAAPESTLKEEGLGGLGLHAWLFPVPEHLVLPPLIRPGASLVVVKRGISGKEESPCMQGTTAMIS